MNAIAITCADTSAALGRSVAQACQRIAPTWPLDQFIAVNPWWGFVDQPVATAAAQLGALSGARTLMPRAYFQQQWQAGRLGREHLGAAIAAAGASCCVDALIDALAQPQGAATRLPLVTDLVDARRDLRHAMAWRDFVTHQISQHCAAYFDRSQATWSPDRDAGLYASWVQQAARDRGPLLLMGDAGYAQRARAAPVEPMAMIELATRELGMPEDAAAAYFTALLLSINGWASWCAYERWQARLRGGDDERLVELLAIRLAWDWLLFKGAHGGAVDATWSASWARHAQLVADSQAAMHYDWLLQDALERAYQMPLCADLRKASRAETSQVPAVQAVFCIDVRSEVFRRALESVAPDVRTSGFAGFFGLPIDYAPLGTALTRPQLPGLLAPALRVTDVATTVSQSEALAGSRRRVLSWRQRWQEFRTSASSGFTFVESLGIAYAAKLLDASLPRPGDVVPPEQQGLSAAERRRLRPALVESVDGGNGLDVAGMCELAFGILNAMGLTTGFARLVLLAGHGSQTANNPHAAGLDCGACGGETGEVNARALAALLNDPRVRQGLLARGVTIPDETRFVAGLHNTTTDEVTLYDVEVFPSGLAADLAQLRAHLIRAGELARAERAPSLGLGDIAQRTTALRRAIGSMANDWAQVRPEWGLVDNAAFIVAPRARSRHLDLAGRVFLHDYDWRGDAGLDVLELIMTAPMIVTHWINMQYYASTVDNARYGSGNKVLHNVVGGRLGVFEGNGGDLRIGLPMQSLHDGSAWRHTPLRLSVFIEAPVAGIDRVIAKHDLVRQLLDHEWLHLFRIEPDGPEIFRYRRGNWAAVPTSMQAD